MILTYDGSFEGFLSVVFECYARKTEPSGIFKAQNHQEAMFTRKENIVTDIDRANRVWRGLQKKIDRNFRQLPYVAFLSGDEGIEMNLYRFIRLAFSLHVSITGNYADPDVLTVQKSYRKVMKEAMRMMQFVRFQRTSDDIYFAPVSPDYDVIPMILKQFKNRFADQQWLIYDLKRDYGFFYNLQKIEEVMLNEKSFSTSNGLIPVNMLQEEEASYRKMWQDYCRNITIRERLNPKLQKQHMPKRYWKFLPEKALVDRLL